MDQMPLISVKEGAQRLNVSAIGLYRKLQSGALPVYRFGRKVLIDLDEVRSAMRPLPKGKEEE